MGCRQFAAFAALAAIQVRVDHFADDGAGPDERHLHHDVVELLRQHAREGGHLGAAFHLEHADGVGFVQSFEDGRIVLRNVREVDVFAINLGHERDAIFEHGHHAEAEQIDFDDAHIGAVFFVPLDDDAAGHAGGFEGHDGIELVLADDHAAGVLAEVARQVLREFVELEEFAHLGRIEVEAGIVKAGARWCPWGPSSPRRGPGWRAFRAR